MINKKFLSSDDDCADTNQKSNRNEGSSLQGPPVGANPFLDIPQNIATVEYKKGYVMRKCCYDSNNKKSKLKNELLMVNGVIKSVDKKKREHFQREFQKKNCANLFSVWFAVVGCTKVLF